MVPAALRSKVWETIAIREGCHREASALSVEVVRGPAPEASEVRAAAESPPSYTHKKRGVCHRP